MEAYLGEIRLWPLDWAPEGWMFCDGALLDVAKFQALYSLLGTRYGGDGRIKFALPSLKGRFVVGPEKANDAGKTGGSETTPFRFPLTEVPEHTHEAKFVPGVVKPVTPVKIEVNNTTASANAVITPSGNFLSKGYPSAGAGNLKSYATSGDATFLGGVQGGGGGGIVDGTVTVESTGTKDIVVKGNFSTISPFLALNFIICCEGGDYPPKSD